MRIDRNYSSKVKIIENFIKKWWIISSLEQIKELLWYANRAGARLFLQKMIKDWLLELINNKYSPTNLLSWYPLFESVRAGLPFTPQSETDSQIQLNSYLIEHPNSTFFVKVKWDSMQDAGIVEWDIAIVDKSMEVKNWDIIIASIEWDVTIKYYKKTWNRITLIPANNNYKPLIIDNDAEILWVVVGTIRKYN